LCLPYPCIIQTTIDAASGLGEISQNNLGIGEIPQESAGKFFCQSSAGIFDGEIREAIAELRQHREALREQAAESREWRGLFSRFDGSRIANVARGLYWMVMACIGAVTVAAVAVAAKYVAEAVKAFRGKT
jgi:hypothetical protein